MIDTYSVNNLSEYIAIIEKNSLFDCISRGENDKYETPLASSIYRSGLGNYCKLLETYLAEVEPTLNSLQKKHFTAFSQHHGIPTNLIDFSSSPLISLFFSCDSKKQKGYVYFIDKSKFVNVNNVVPNSEPGWGLLNELLSWDENLFRTIYPCMSKSFIMHREEMITFFEKHSEQYINAFKQRRFPDYLSSIVGVSDFEKALEKYRIDRQEWLNEGRCEREITLQIKDSIPNMLKGMINIYKNDICYPSLFIDNYLNRPHTNNSPYSANVDVMLFLLKMEVIEGRNVQMMTDMKEKTPNAPFKLSFDFPFYFTYQPPVIDERVKNQSSIFVLQPFSSYVNPMGNIEEIWLNIKPDYIVEINNPKNILNELDAIGINSKSVFCDYDHIAQYMVSKKQDG